MDQVEGTSDPSGRAGRNGDFYRHASRAKKHRVMKESIKDCIT